MNGLNKLKISHFSLE